MRCPLPSLGAAFLLLVAALSGGAQAAAWEGVFIGTLGKAKVLVQLAAPEGASDYPGYAEGSRYSYLPKVMDLSLVLEAEGAHLRFIESAQSNFSLEDLKGESADKITGRWDLVVKADGATGTWTDPKGARTLPIALTRATLLPQAGLAEDVNRLTATYDGIWGSSIRFSAPQESVAFGSVQIAMAKDKVFGVAYPRFIRYPDPVAMGRINAYLDQQHRDAVIGARTCRNGLRFMDAQGEPTAADEPEFAFAVTYASPRLLSVDEGGSVYCGGAHPNNYATAHTFDLLRLARLGGAYQLDLKPEGFGGIFKLATKEQRLAFERFWWRAWMDNAKSGGENADPECQSGFQNETPEGEREATLSFTKDGLAVLRTDYAHVSSNCLAQDFNPLIIKWVDLKPWIRPGQDLLVEELSGKP